MGLKAKVRKVLKLLFLSAAGQTGPGQNIHNAPKELP